jgi:IS605 OrfB family transposase
MTRLKGKRKRPRKYQPKSIDYDARIFSYREQDEEISLKTTRGRLRIPLILSEYQRRALQGRATSAAIVIRKGEAWYIHIVVEVPSMPSNGEGVIGIDLGIRNIATTTTDLCIKGKDRQEFKKKRAKVRASLQSKGTRGARKVLRRLSGYESRRIRYENHVLSKQIVSEAKRHNCGVIRMEQLKGIREKTRQWNKHLNRMVAGWSFYQLQQFVIYKASAAGITVELIDPAYTSQTCHQCLKLGSRNGELFKCLTCGDKHADVNALHLIALGGAACKSARINNPKVS